MPLDMFGQAQADTDAYVRANNSPHLPAGFGDVFQANWNENRLFGQSIAGANAKQSAFNDYLDDVKRKTGEKFDDMSYEAGPSQLIPYVNDKVAKLKEANPDLQIDPLTDEELDRRTVAKSRQARADLEEMNAREKTLGGSLGGLAGGAAGALTDPVNLVAAPLAAPEGLGLLATSLAWAGIAGGSQAAIEAVGSPYRDTVQPGYSQSGEPARNILGAAAFGGVAGGSFKALGMAWSRAKTGVWPRSVRDAGNVVESEANVAQTNVLPSIEGEVAHRDALAKSIDDVVSGRKIDVPADIPAPHEAKLGALMDERAGARGEEIRGSVQHQIGDGVFVEGDKAFVEGAPRSDYIARIAESDTQIPSVEDLRQAAAATQDADRRYSNAVGINDADFKRMRTLNRIADEGGIAADEAIAELKTIREKATGDHELDIADEGSIRQLITEFRSLEQQGGETLSQYEDGIARVLKRYVANYVDRDDFARAVFKKAFVEARAHGFDTRKLGNDVIDRFMSDLSDSDRAFMKKEFSDFTRTKAPVSEQLKLPLEPAKTEVHQATIADGVSSIAQRAGYDMPREEAEKVAKMVAGASTDEQARAILSTVADRPQTVSEFPPSPLPKAPEVPAPRGDLTPATVEKTLGSPDHEAAMRADIDRARATGDIKIPAGVDEKGEPIFRSLDGAMDEIDAYKAAADQIKACANPQPEPAEAA